MAENDPNDVPPSGGPLRMLVIVGLLVALIGGVLFVVEQLRGAAAIQDCVASGRTNCAPISSGH